MEMTTYQAVFAVLLIFFLGDLVGALTKAKISSMFVIMMGFLVLFMTGIYPDNVMEISGFAGVASLGQYFLLFNMGTSVDIPTLKRECARCCAPPWAWLPPFWAASWSFP